MEREEDFYILLKFLLVVLLKFLQRQRYFYNNKNGNLSIIPKQKIDVGRHKLCCGAE